MYRKKYLIYFLIFIFFNFIFINSLKADPTFNSAVSVSSEIQFSYGITFDDDGDKMYITGFNSSGDTGDRVIEYDLTTNYDVSTKSVSHTLTTNVSARPHDIRFNNDGSRMYLPLLNQTIKTFSLSTAYDLSTASLIHTSSIPSNSSTNEPSIEFNTNGTKVFIEDGDEIDEYDVATAFDLSSTLTYVDSLSFSFTATSMAFSDDGTVLFLLTQKSNDKSIYEYNLTCLLYTSDAADE